MEESEKKYHGYSVCLTHDCPRSDFIYVWFAESH